MGRYNKFRVGINGRPCGPDVDKLMRELCLAPDGSCKLAAGAEIPKQAVVACVGEGYDTNRYNSVVGSWRRRLDRVHNILLEVTEDSYRVLNNEDRAEFSGNCVHYGIRKIARAGDVAVRTDRSGVTSEGQRILDHVVRCRTALVSAFDAEKRQLRFALSDIRSTTKRK